MVVNMSQVESHFMGELYKKYEHCKKYLIPKEEYDRTIEELKVAGVDSRTKSRRGYYVLSK